LTTVTLPARAVAAPVLERLGSEARGTVLGTATDVAWARVGGFVVLLSTGAAPLLPNSVALVEGQEELAGARAGDPVVYRPGLLRVGPVAASWDPDDPPVWEPRVVPAVGDPGRVRRRGEALLRALGAPLPIGDRAPGRAICAETSSLTPLMALAGVVIATEAGGASAIGTLLDAVARQDAVAAAGAAGELCGRGTGLTPEGDEVLVAVTASMVTLGPTVGVRAPDLASWVGALVPPPDAGDRTSDLARSLVRLAAHGRLLEPAGHLLDLTATGERRWPSALTRLLRARHASGHAYAAGIAATACALTAARRAGFSRHAVGWRRAQGATGAVPPGRSQGRPATTRGLDGQRSTAPERAANDRLQD
jgi:Protein of unknown function (DUF2877)